MTYSYMQDSDEMSGEFVSRYLAARKGTIALLTTSSFEQHSSFANERLIIPHDSCLETSSEICAVISAVLKWLSEVSGWLLPPVQMRVKGCWAAGVVVSAEGSIKMPKALIQNISRVG
jgi:hypothetical protein